jgi:hypothetical protein
MYFFSCLIVNFLVNLSSACWKNLNISVVSHPLLFGFTILDFVYNVNVFEGWDPEQYRYLVSCIRAGGSGDSDKEILRNER